MTGMSNRKITMVKMLKRCIFLCALILASLQLQACGSKADGYFMNLKWDTPMYEVHAQRIIENPDGVKESTDGNGLVETIPEYLGVEGVDARIEYNFKDFKLSEVFVYLEFDENTYSNEEIMSRYADIISDELGKCKQDTAEMKLWKAGKSEVQLANYYYGELVLDYKKK